MLVELARRGDVDPWNVDVIDVTDKFLSELERAKKLDLRVSGRVLLFAAILIRLKADILTNEAAGHEEPEEEVELESEPEPEGEIVPDEIDFDAFQEPEPDEAEGFDKELESLEQEVQKDEVLDTLLKPRKKAKRFTTLKDLIHELQMAEDVEKKRKKRKRKKKEEEPVTRETLATPHEENLEETIAKVEEELKYLFNRKTMLYFSEVVRGLGTEEKISYYLSILHLAYRKKVEVYQKKLYEEDIELKHYS